MHQSRAVLVIELVGACCPVLRLSCVDRTALCCAAAEDE
jgi:hypothetical protein